MTCFRILVNTEKLNGKTGPYFLICCRKPFSEQNEPIKKEGRHARFQVRAPDVTPILRVKSMAGVLVVCSLIECDRFVTDGHFAK